MLVMIKAILYEGAVALRASMNFRTLIPRGLLDTLLWRNIKCNSTITDTNTVSSFLWAQCTIRLKLE